MISVQKLQATMTSQLKDAEKRPSTPETLPGTVSSCSLEDIATHTLVEALTLSPTLSPATNNHAPSSVCQQRKLSAAIVTSEDVAHDIVAGRPTMTIEDLNKPADSTFQNFSTSKNRDLAFETPPRPKPGKHHRGVSTCDSKRNRDETLRGSSSSLINHKSLTRQISAPSYPTYAALRNEPHATRMDAWAEAPATSYSVRGPNYLRDKQKEASDEALFSLLTLDIVQTVDNKPILKGLCNHPNERIQRALRREQETGLRELPEFIWAINLAVPGPPFYHVMVYFGCEDIEALKDTTTPLGRLTKPFFFGSSDEFRDNTFKLIPKIVDGNFVVKKAVGTKPSILGRKLKQHYIRHPRFFELIVDISSDSIAKNVVALSMGYAKQLVTDMMFMLEGDSDDTLPERILGGVRLKNLDFKKRDGQRKVQNYRS